MEIVSFEGFYSLGRASIMAEAVIRNVGNAVIVESKRIFNFDSFIKDYEAVRNYSNNISSFYFAKSKDDSARAAIPGVKQVKDVRRTDTIVLSGMSGLYCLVKVTDEIINKIQSWCSQYVTSIKNIKSVKAGMYMELNDLGWLVGRISNEVNDLSEKYDVASYYLNDKAMEELKNGDYVDFSDVDNSKIDFIACKIIENPELCEFFNEDLSRLDSYKFYEFGTADILCEYFTGEPCNMDGTLFRDTVKWIIREFDKGQIADFMKDKSVATRIQAFLSLIFNCDIRYGIKYITSFYALLDEKQDISEALCRNRTVKKMLHDGRMLYSYHVFHVSKAMDVLRTSRALYSEFLTEYNMKEEHLPLYLRDHSDLYY